ncbi:NAD-dependent epimerase/dehydratase family protein [compost metagenome]
MSHTTNGLAYNIGSEFSITILELAHKIRQLAGSASPIVFVPYEQAYGAGYEDMAVRIPDITRSRNMLHYNPAISLDDGLQRSIGWFRQQLQEGRL